MGAQQGVQGSLCLPCPACLSLLSRAWDLCPSPCALGPFCPFCDPGPCWAQLHIKSPFSLPAWPRQFALRAALCPPFFPKQYVFNQFYNKTQTEFLKTTAMTNNHKSIPAPQPLRFTLPPSQKTHLLKPAVPGYQASSVSPNCPSSTEFLHLWRA